MMEQSKKLLTRREALKASRFRPQGLVCKDISAEISGKAQLIVEENLKPGSTDWQLTRVRYDSTNHRSPYIEGYCSKQSVKAGEPIEIMVSTNPANRFKLEIFRTGYYGGRGARLMKTYDSLEGYEQPTPEPGLKDIHECNWKPSVSLTIPADWLSGVYLGRLTILPVSTNEPYWQSYVIFIVTDDRPADFLFQCADNTWQAYNQWPSKYSLYTHPDGRGGWVGVSFDRPYGRQGQYNSVVNDPLSFGSGEFISLEQPFTYFLEQHGYDVTYCSNSDMLTPDRGLKCKAFICAGHDEYWDLRLFSSLERMRDEGVNLMFFSGNITGWVTPFHPNSHGVANRIIFRDGYYSGDKGRSLKIEESVGSSFSSIGPDEGMLLGVRNVSPINGGGDWIVANPDHWIFDGTGVKKGDRIRGLVGWEYMGSPAPIEGIEVVAKGTAWVSGELAQHWESTIYPGPKGNFVFTSSTIFWAQGLSMPPGHMLPWSHYSRPHGPDQRVQRITHNLLSRAIA
jgi:hypothetical protein